MNEKLYRYPAPPDLTARWPDCCRTTAASGGSAQRADRERARGRLFVLHCFQKKSKSGIATPNEDIEIIRARLKVAEAIAKEMRDGKAHR
jgi:hypothetical protein